MRRKRPKSLPGRGSSAPIIFTIVTYWTFMLLVGCGIHVTGGPFIRQVPNDFNGDGFTDVIVGANQEDSGGSLAGAAYIFFGSASLSTSIDASAANVKMIGETAGDELGVSVAFGDINNDGFADAIVGALGEDAGGSSAGAVYIFYGSSSSAASIDASAANVKLIGEAAGDLLGESVASGDINNDGYDDIIVGASRENTGGSDAGAAYIFYGSSTLPASIDASLANVKMIGGAANDNFGTSTASGDINNDGFADTIVGAPLENTGGDNAGAAYIFYGSTTLASSINASAANVKLIGETDDDELGGAVGSGDVNNDGFSDAIVGSTSNSNTGAAYIFYGSTTLATSIDASAANVKMTGEALSDGFGRATTTGDINNDGFQDAIVGANGESTGGANAGAAYIFYGSTSLASSIPASTANIKIIGETALDQLGQSVASGDVNNDGFSDAIVGAVGDDTGGGAAGAAYILYGTASLASSIDASAANVKMIGEAAGDSFGTSVK